MNQLQLHPLHVNGNTYIPLYGEDTISQGQINCQHHIIDYIGLQKRV